MFYTKFIKPTRVCCLYDPYDAVDRLTYVDTTVQISRMMQAGVNLAFRSNQGLPTGDFENDNSPAAPVYTVDPALSANMIKSYKQSLKDNAERARQNVTGVATEQTTKDLNSSGVNAPEN